MWTREVLSGRHLSMLVGLALSGQIVLTIFSALLGVSERVVPAAFAQSGAQTVSYSWRRVAIGGGGFITGYDADPTGATRVVRTDVHGAYIWIDDRNRWSQLVTSAAMPALDRVQNGMNEGVYEVAVAPSDPNRIYMIIKGKVYRSDNRGKSFIQASHSAPFPIAVNPNGKFRHAGPFMAVDPRRSDVLLVAIPKNGVWRSDDSGASWRKVLETSASVENPPIVWFGPRASDRPSYAYSLSPGEGFFEATNGIDFARTSPNGGQPLGAKQASHAKDGTLYISDSESKSVWRYRNGNWTDLTNKPGLRPYSFSAIAVNPSNGDVYVFDQGGRAFRSRSSGEVWDRLRHQSRVGDGEPPWLRIANVAYFAMGRVMFDPVVANRLWVCAGTGVYYADVSPESTTINWISHTRGIEELVTTDAIHMPGHQPLFAGWDFGVHRKEKLDEFSSTFGPKERVIIAVQQLDWSASNPAFVVTNSSDTRLNCCSQDGDSVLAGYSEDAGLSWKKFKTLPQPPGTRADDPWRMSFGSIAVSSTDSNNIVWVPSFNRSPFFTKDRGDTWRRISLPGEKLPFTGSHEKYYYTRKIVAADRVDGNIFYFVHSGGGDNQELAGLWKTVDGGENWQRVFAGEVAPNSRFSAKLRSVPANRGHLFFTSGLGGGADTKLRRSVDGGATWTTLVDLDRVDDIAFGKEAYGRSYPTIYISGRVRGEYGIWRSIDDCATWQRIAQFPMGSLDQVTAIEANKDTFGVVYIGYMGSSWIYGREESCEPVAFKLGDDQECRRVD